MGEGGRGAEGAEMGVMWGGVSPLGNGYREGLCPSPEYKSILDLK